MYQSLDTFWCWRVFSKIRMTTRYHVADTLYLGLDPNNSHQKLNRSTVVPPFFRVLCETSAFSALNSCLVHFNAEDAEISAEDTEKGPGDT